MDIYQELILDLSKNPKNFYEMDDALKLEVDNPLCGDRVTIYFKIEEDRISLSFTASGCAISIASASLMTEELKGKTVSEAKEIIEKFFSVLKGGEGSRKMQAFANLKNYPSRIKCATLAWHAAKSLIE